MGAIFNAQANKSPLLITAGQQVRAQITMQANLTNRDATRVPHPFVKWSLRAAARRGRAARARARHPPRVAAAERARRSSRCRWTTGRVEVDDARRRARRSAATVTGRAGADPEAVRAARPAARAAQNPVLVAGPDIDASGGWDAAVALAERCGCRSGPRPAPGGGRLGFPEGHPHFRGVLPPAIGPLGQTLEGHDLVLVAGSSVFPYYPYIPGPPLPEGAELVAITSDPDEAARAPMGDAIVADVRLTLEALLAEVGESDRAAPEPLGDPPPVEDTDPLSPVGRARDAGRGAARRRDRRARVADQHARAAQPPAHLAARAATSSAPAAASATACGGDRRAARPARPPGGLRARRGLGAVRDQRVLDRGRLQGAGHVPGPAQRGVRDPQVVRRDRAGDGRARARPAGARDRRDRPGLRHRRPRSVRGRDELREALDDGVRRRRAASWSRSRSTPGMSLF